MDQVGQLLLGQAGGLAQLAHTGFQEITSGLRYEAYFMKLTSYYTMRMGLSRGEAKFYGRSGTDRAPAFRGRRALRVSKKRLCSFFDMFRMFRG